MRVAFALALCACSSEPLATGERWTDADALFHAEPRWLGGDGAYTIDARLAALRANHIPRVGVSSRCA